MTWITFRFGIGESGNAYLEDGWSTPESGFVWCTGETSHFTLPIGGATKLGLQIIAYLQPPALTRQRLSIFIDGTKVGEATLTKVHTTIKVAPPPSDKRLRQITLWHPDFSKGPDTDPRSLSMALSIAGAEIRADDPVLTDDLLVPPPAVLMDGSITAEQFRWLGEGFTQNSLIRRAGLQPQERVLEIGSGNGQKARVLARYLTSGSYDGIDIVLEPIQWCRDRFAHLEHFNFHVADVASSHYRPEGTQGADTYRLPFPDECFDLVFLCSVFTHMLPAEVTNYTREIARVLRRGGRCVATYFLLHDDVSGWADPQPMTFTDALGTAHVLDAADPAKGVALDEAAARADWRAAGMRVAEITFGRWSGAPDRLHALQDAMLIAKPD